ncbi:AAA family ATPase [Lentzea rhizosphaerae]|uniref:AAA family ATPase n=1 Tax=Lentzea rhizosphaerae TaxID=2041025 RepID=A0ABV8BPP2_9PSEU
MRLASLELICYGIFENQRLDLAEPGLHVVRGANGAGKSTIVNAIPDLLYGVPWQSDFTFAFPTTSLRLSAELVDESGSSLNIVRRKGRKHTLMTPDGELADESKVTALVGDLTRDEYMSSFVLSQDELRKGGAAIAAGRGHLGELLYHARGLAGPAALLAELARRKDTIYRPRGRNLDLNRAVDEYKRSRDHLRDSVVRPQVVVDLTAEIKQLQETVDREHQELLQLRPEQKRWITARAMHPVLLRRRQLLKELSELADDGPVVASAVRDELAKIRAILRESAAAMKSADDELTRISDRLRELVVDCRVLEHADEIELLAGQAHSQQETRDRLALLTLELEPAEQELRLALARVPKWSQEDAAVADIPDDVPVEVSRLAEKHHNLGDELAEATREVKALREECEQLDRRLAEMPEPPATTDLQSAIVHVRGQEVSDKQVAQVRAQHRQAMAKVARELENLLADVDVEQVANLALPLKAATTALVRRFDSLAERERDLATRRASLRKRTRKNKLALDGVLAGDPPPTEDELASARGDRDTRLDALAAGNPTSRLTVVREHVARTDHMADRMRREADTAARRASYEQALCVDADDAAELTQLETSCNDERASLDEKWREHWTAVCLSVPPEVHEGLEVLARLTQARDHASAAADHETRAVELSTVVEENRRLLRQVLADTGHETDPSTPLSRLLALADAQLTALDDAAREHSDVRRDRQQLDKRITQAARRIKKAEDDLAAWRLAWDVVLARAGVEDADPHNALTLVEDRLRCQRLATKVAHLLAERDQLTARVDEFSAHVLELVSHAGISSVTDVALMLTRLVSALRAQQKTAHTQAVLLEQQQTAEGLHAAATASDEAARAALGELLDRHDLPDEVALEQALGRGDRQADLAKQLDQCAKDLSSSGMETEALEAMIDEKDLAEIELILSNLDNEINSRQQRKDEATQLLGTRNAERNAYDTKAPVAVEAAQSTAERRAAVEGFAEEYLRVHLAEHLLRGELERYRAEHQDSVLRHAETLFSTLTMQEYPRLEATYDDRDTPVLLAHPSHGSPRRVDQLNEGARDQLYLALRLATLKDYATRHRGMPLLLDDIFMTFDDRRTPVGLEVLANLVDDFQVVVFTHHDAVAEIASRSSTIRGIVHELPSVA